MTQEILKGLFDTLYMSVVATLCAYIIGLPLGIILAATDKNGLKPNTVINKSLGIVINILRSIPFLILLVLVVPFTRLVVGTSIGASATIVPLTLAASPFVARLVESSIKEVDGGVIEVAQSFGTPALKIIFKAVIHEALPSILSNAVISFVTVVGYSAMAGACGGGGLGQIAINYGYYRNDRNVMYIAVAIIVVIVQIFQEFGLWLVRFKDKRRKNK